MPFPAILVAPVSAGGTWCTRTWSETRSGCFPPLSASGVTVKGLQALAGGLVSERGAGEAGGCEMALSADAGSSRRWAALFSAGPEVSVPEEALGVVPFGGAVDDHASDQRRAPGPLRQVGGRAGLRRISGRNRPRAVPPFSETHEDSGAGRSLQGKEAPAGICGDCAKAQDLENARADRGLAPGGL